MERYFVYAVVCNDGTYYIGVTNNVERRIGEHNEGINPRSYTYSRRPVRLKYVSGFQDVNQAMAWETRIKGWSRAKKEAWFEQEWQRIKYLARNRQ